MAMRSKAVRAVFLAADHAGFELKEKIKAYLETEGYRVKDFGPHAYDPEDDYPDFVIPAAEAVAKDKNSLGIAVCGTGDGVCIAANKVKGVRATLVYDTHTAYSSRYHNDANVLCIGSGNTTDRTTRGLGLTLTVAKKIISVWLTTPFSNAARHIRRIKKISHYET